MINKLDFCVNYQAKNDRQNDTYFVIVRHYHPHMCVRCEYLKINKIKTYVWLISPHFVTATAVDPNSPVRIVPPASKGACMSVSYVLSQGTVVLFVLSWLGHLNLHMSSHALDKMICHISHNAPGIFYQIRKLSHLKCKLWQLGRVQ